MPKIFASFGLPLKYWLCFLCFGLNMFQASGQLFAPQKQHSLMPFSGLFQNRVTELNMSLGQDAQIVYTNGDALRIPVGLRYQYRWKRGTWLGADLCGNYNTLMISPQYRIDPPNTGFSGPMVINHAGSMLGMNLHYAKSKNFKVLSLTGMAGLGGFFQFEENKKLTVDYSWYLGAPAAFYRYAPAATHQVIRTFLPALFAGGGLRFGKLEVGYALQRSLLSPVKNFEYLGVQQRNSLRFTSSGFYAGCRFEF